MSFIDTLRPTFWNYEDVATGPHQSLFSFRRKWWRMVILTTIVALAPLFILSVVNYRLTRADIRRAADLQTRQELSGIWRSVSFFVSERRSVMEFVLKDNTLSDLSGRRRLAAILKNLKSGIGGFEDLAVVAEDGRLLAYAGPGRPPAPYTYCNEPCFKMVITRGYYVGDLQPGQRPGRFLVMAVRSRAASGRFFVLRATVAIKPFEKLMSTLDVAPAGDVFLVNQSGVLQTRSRFFGPPPRRVPFDIPAVSTDSRVMETTAKNGMPLIVGLAGVPDTALIVMTVFDKNKRMAGWRQLKIKFWIFLGISVAAILLMVLGMATYLVNRIHASDQKRIRELHKVEYANKMAALGRLSAGVGHEINNPVAIINEKSGLINDLLLQSDPDPLHEKLVGLVDDIRHSARRIGKITGRLIDFGRYREIRPQPVDIQRVLYDLVAFMEEEAESSGIYIRIQVPEKTPVVISDKNSLQQIFLNIINNAFGAMASGGRLDIVVKNSAPGQVSITFTDTGPGIAPEEQKRVFEPFFSSTPHASGTGLGLSVTYGLVSRLRGRIRIDSEPGKGAAFIVLLPVDINKDRRRDDVSDDSGKALP